MALSTAAHLAYRESGPKDGPVALLLHGFPESSYMWRSLLAELAEDGWHGVAPDFAGYGDSPPDPPGTWSRQVDALARFVEELDLRDVVLVVHDWGGLIGLRWACDHAERVRALVISGTGFFPDGRWHGMAEALRAPGTGEQLVESLTPESFGQLLAQSATGIDSDASTEYAKCLATPAHRRGLLELYRSGDFSELLPYEGRLAALDVPSLIVWGGEDAFAPVGGAHRLHRELGRSELAVLDGVGHFLWEDAPAASDAAVRRFLAPL